MGRTIWRNIQLSGITAFFIVFPLHGFEEVSYEIGMAESVGICEAISYLLSLFRQQTLYLYFLLI